MSTAPSTLPEQAPPLARLIPIDRIKVGPRLRAVDPAWVRVIAESFAERGQDTAVRVTVPDAEGYWHLIAGGHRLPAAIQAGWTEILASEFEGSPLQARLLEIDENLLRRELSELDRAAFLTQRKEVWEELHPETKHGGRRRGDQVAKAVDLKIGRFTADAAATLGASERSVQRALRRYGELEPAVRVRLSPTRLAHSGAVLDALTRLGPKDQARAVDLMLDPESGVKDVAHAIRVIKQTPAPDEAEVQYRRLFATWGRCTNARARKLFLDQLFAMGALPGAKAA